MCEVQLIMQARVWWPGRWQERGPAPRGAPPPRLPTAPVCAILPHRHHSARLLVTRKPFTERILPFTAPERHMFFQISNVSRDGVK